LDDATKFAAVLKETGLRATGSHIEADRSRRKNWMSLSKGERARDSGDWYRVRDSGATKRSGGVLASICRDAELVRGAVREGRLTFYYHHHNFEFDPKFRAIDVLHDKLGKDVKLEIDCFWASVGGTDPVNLIEQWNGRLFALH